MEQRLDVSALEAPEPLVLAVDALQSLPAGDYLRLRHRMKPCHLYDWLEQHRFAWDTRHGEEVECELFVWHQGDVQAEVAARQVADGLRPWHD